VPFYPGSQFPQTVRNSDPIIPNAGYESDSGNKNL
jgi:hypothetical protein